MSDMKPDVWQSVEFSSDGITITTYSQVLSQKPEVEDQSSFTWEELMENKD